MNNDDEYRWIVSATNKQEYAKGYQQGRADREAEIVSIIEQMKESASAMMWTEREVACEKILEQIKEQKNEMC